VFLLNPQTARVQQNFTLNKMNKKISYTAYSDIKSEYFKALAWLEGYKITYTRGRLESYKQSLNEMIDLLQQKEQPGVNKRFPELINTIHEIDAIVKIYKSLIDIEIPNDSVLKEKLKRAIGGPVDLVDENNKNNAARNYLFEVLVASRFSKPNASLNVDFVPTNDLKLNHRNESYYIECKRISSVKKLGKNVADARDQICSTLKDEPTGQGLVVVDLSKIINPKFGISVRQYPEELNNHITQEIDNFVLNNHRIWQSKLNKFCKSIPAIILYCSFMGVAESTNHIFTVQQWALNPMDDSSNDSTENMKHLVEKLKNNI